MKISKETLEVLKNFATIQDNLVVAEGSVITTIADAKNIMASAKVTEDFKVPFGIYDLSQFLAVLGLFPDAELEFGESDVIVRHPSLKRRIRYVYADEGILTSVSKQVKMPDADVTVEISEEMIGQIRKSAAVLGHTILSIQNDNGTVSLNVVDGLSSSGNEFTLETDVKAEGTFNLEFLIASLKLLPGDYTVDLAAKGLSKWTHKQTETTYWIALENTSSFTK